MKRTALGLAALALALFLAVDSTGAQEKELSIKDIMKKAHRPQTGLLDDLGMDLKADEPEWKEIQDHTKEIVVLITALGKNDPPQGDKASWAKLTKGYLDNAKALDTAAKKKDKDGALAVHTKMKMACAGCHTVHRPK